MAKQDQKTPSFFKKMRSVLLAATAITGTAQMIPAAASEPECTYLADPELPHYAPEVATHLQAMKSTPAGRFAVDGLQQPQHFLKTCLVTAFDKAATQASYNYLDKSLKFTTDQNIANVVHEAFHAYQDIGGKLEEILSPLKKPVLTAHDSYVAHMLVEATATAYTMIVLKQNEHQDPIMYNTFINGDDTYGDHAYGVGPLFEQTYNHVLEQRQEQGVSYAQAEKDALEKAGQAVVRDMIFGENDIWRKNYEAAFFNNVASRDYPLIKGEDYEEKRRDIYTAIGQVTTTFNLTPPEFRTTQADQIVRTALRTAPMGFGKF